MFPVGGGGDDLNGRDVPPAAGRALAGRGRLRGIVRVFLNPAPGEDATGPMRTVLVIMDVMAVGLSLYGLFGRRE